MKVPISANAHTLANDWQQAHKHVEAGVGKMFGPGAVTSRIKKEIRDEVSPGPSPQKTLLTYHNVSLPENFLQIFAAEMTIQQYLPFFPNVFYSVKTGLTARILLYQYRTLLEETNDMGCLDGQHYHHAIQACDDAINCLASHSHAEFCPMHSVLLATLPFFRFLSEQQLNSMFGKSKKKNLFADVYVK